MTICFHSIFIVNRWIQNSLPHWQSSCRLIYFTRIFQWNFYDVELIKSKFSKTWKMETKEKAFTSSKELIKSKFSRTWKIETREKFLTSSKISFLFPYQPWPFFFFFSEPKKIQIKKRKISYSLVIKSRKSFNIWSYIN